MVRILLVIAVFAAVFAAVFVGLSACGDSVSQENLEKIKAGMTVTEVSDILGDADEKGTKSISLGGGYTGVKTWTSGEKTITVTFAGGKVVGVPLGSGL